MADEPVRSPLAQKALAQKALRDEETAAAHAKAEASRIAIQEFNDKVRQEWRNVLDEYQTVVNDINTELFNTGTSARLIVPSDSPSSHVGSLSVQVRIEGAQNVGRYHALHMNNDGQMYLRESLKSGAETPERRIEYLQGDTGWIEPAVRTFFDRALS